MNTMVERVARAIVEARTPGLNLTADYLENFGHMNEAHAASAVVVEECAEAAKAELQSLLDPEKYSGTIAFTVAAIRRLRAENDRLTNSMFDYRKLENEIERLRAALKPFAEAAKTARKIGGDPAYGLRWDDFLRAQKLLEEK